MFRGVRAGSVECGLCGRTHNVVQQRQKVLNDVDEQLGKSWQKELNQDQGCDKEEEAFHGFPR